MTRGKTTMEKRLLLFLVLSFALMFLYTQFLSPPPPEPKPDGTGESGEPLTGTGTAPGEDPGVEPAAEPSDPTPEDPSEDLPEVPAEPGATLSPQAAGMGEPFTVYRDTARWVFDSWGGSVRIVALSKYTREAGQDLSDENNWYRVISDVDSAGEAPNSSRSVTLRLLDDEGKRILPLDRVLWKLVEKSPDRVVYRLPVPDAGLEFEKIYTFPNAEKPLEHGDYHVTVELGVRVLDRTKALRYAPDNLLRLSLRGPGGLPVEAFSQGTTVMAVVQDNNRADPEEIGPPGKVTDPAEVYPEVDEQTEGRYLEWVGMHSRFFAAVLKAVNSKDTAIRQATFEPVQDRLPGGKDFANLAPALQFDIALPETGGSAAREFMFYVGPMDPDVLSAAPYESFKSIIDYGFFGPIVKVLVFLLAAIRSVVGNWGVAIIILTLIVRASLFPLSRKSQVSMQKYQRQMARLKPKIDDIKKRHAKNKKKQQEEQMKLMKEEGMQMFPAGCLVMFLQLPVFIGLFQALRYTIGLRHSAFLWASDLTAPDQLAGPWSGHGIPLFWDPFYLNVFPILMGITWYLSSAMAPKPADPQQAQQMKMMKWMPIIFSIMLYNYPAGLALYMVVSSTWSIFEMKVVRKVFLKPDESGAAVAATFRKGK